MRHWRLVCTVVAVAAFSAVIASQTPSGHAVFEQALAKERVEGNLLEAIKLYERVVAEFASDRPLAAQALVQVGLCYEKLGRDEAIRAYERLVRDFADQEDAVEQARVRLAALKRPGPAAVAGGTSREVSALPRVDTNNEVLSMSPDGSKIAFLDYDKGQNLAVYDLVSQKTTRLTNFDWTPASSWVYDAAWSPDGRRIAYKQCPVREPEDACELQMVTLSGESRVIARNQTQGTRPVGWLPDGSAIVVTLQRRDRTATIGLVPTDGGPFVPLRSTSWATPYASVSPDGQLIAFVDGTPGDIHVISRNGRTAHRITDHPAEDRFPVWSPDGRHLAFLSDRGGMAALWTVAIRDGQPASDPVRVKDGMQDVYPMLGWTTRGLAYSQYQQAEDIYTVPVDPASGELRGSPQLIPYRRTGHNIVPEWSPDGKYLAFVSSSGSSPNQPDRRVVLLPSGGGDAREFPTPSHRIWTLRWFGDSGGLGITGHGARGERMLFRLTLATGEWQTFPLPVTPRDVQWNGMYFDWNADGSHYFYSWQNNRSASRLTIVERDLQSDRERIVYRADSPDRAAPWYTPEAYRGLRFSPDRRSLSFRQRESIQILDVETGRVRVVHDQGRPQDVPTWSPNGRALLVQQTDDSGTDRRQELQLIPLDGTQARRIPVSPELTRLLSSGRGAPSPTIQSVVWSPDGSRLAFALRTSRIDSFRIENPLAGVADATARR